MDLVSLRAVSASGSVEGTLCIGVASFFFFLGLYSQSFFPLDSFLFLH